MVAGINLVCESDGHVGPSREVQLRNRRRKAKRNRNRRVHAAPEKATEIADFPGHFQLTGGSVISLIPIPRVLQPDTRFLILPTQWAWTKASGWLH